MTDQDAFQEPARILIVEDEGIIGLRLEMVLTNLGYEVAGPVTSGAAALRSVEEHPPDLALVDIKLTGEMDGIETAARIREQFDLPIIYLTAYSEQFMVEKVKHTQPYGFLAKPVRSEELGATVELALYKHRMETKLRESEEKYRLLAENVEDMIWQLNERLDQYTYISPSVTRLLGYTPEELMAMPIGSHLAPVSRLQAQKAIERRLTMEAEGRDHEAAPRGWEFECVRKDGTTVWIESKVRSLRDEDGTYRGLVGVTRDISERKRAEEALRESEERFRTVFEAAQDSIFIKDQNLEYVAVNPAMEQLFDQPRAALIGCTDEELFGEEASAHIREIDARVLAGEIIEEEDTKPVKPGEQRTFHVIKAPMHDASDRIVGLCGIARDITERKRAEEALRESEERYRTLFESLPVGMFRSTPDGRFLDANPAHVRLLGCPDLETLLATPVTDFYVDPEKRQQWRSKVEEEGAAQAWEVAWRRLDGTPIWVQEYARAIRDDEGRVACYEGIVVDVTERKRMEDALRESESRVRRKLDSILLPDGDLDVLNLTDIVDVNAIQEMMENFYVLTGIGIAVLNMEGEVLVATGWQDICTQFHRVHPETSRHCLESDLLLSSGVEPGEYKLYRCKNNMWDMATPIIVGDQQVGNIYLGQFFFEDEDIDRELFREQAHRYGFDEEAYLAALDRVPRWSRETVRAVFELYTQFATMVSKLSRSNLELARALAEKDRLLAARKASEQKLKSYIEHAPYGIFVADESGRYVEVNEEACRLTGYDRDELLTMRIMQLVPPDFLDAAREHFQTVIEEGFSVGEAQFLIKGGDRRWWSVSAVRLSETRFLGYTDDITERKRADEALHQQAERLRILHEIDAAILTAQSPEAIARVALERLYAIIPYQVASVSEINLPQQRGREVVILVSGEPLDADPTWSPFSKGTGVIKVIRQGRTCLVQDMSALETLSPMERYLSSMGMRSYVSIPMLVQDDLVGSLNLAMDKPGFFQPDHIHILEEIAASLTVSMQQARLLAQTQQDAEAKALLLREVNHRVMNNLNMILSILELEMKPSRSQEKELPVVLRDIRGRIQGIATVHQMLSRVEQDSLDPGEIIPQILHAALSGSPMEYEIAVTVDAGADLPQVSSKQAVTLALIINELVTNSIKYAFADRRRGKIRVCIEALEAEDEKSTLRVMFQDDGPGWPEDVLAGDRHSMGLQLIEGSTRHTLGGKISWRNDDGAVAEIQFPIQPAA